MGTFDTEVMAQLWGSLSERRYVLHAGVRAALAETLGPFLLVRAPSPLPTRCVMATRRWGISRLT